MKIRKKVMVNWSRTVTAQNCIKLEAFSKINCAKYMYFCKAQTFL